MSLTSRIVAAVSASVLLFGASAAAAQAAPANLPLPPPPDTEVEFVSDGITYYGSVRTPVGESRGAALLLPGSGPTDRNGNQPGGITPNTLGNIADALAQRGVTTLRFDKFGSGRTGTAGLDPASPPGFVEQVDAAAEALKVLGERTAVPAADLAVLGHSEGALTALSLKQRGAEFDKIGLLEPAAIRYLDLLSMQIDASIDRGVAAGELTPEAADAERERLAETIDAVRTGMPLPYPEDPTLTSIGFVPVNTRFLAEIDSVDAPSIASSLPPETDVLLTCSEKDLNVSCDQIDALGDALAYTDLQYPQFATASHALGELGPLPATGLDIFVPLPMSVEFRTALDGWTDHAFG